MQHTQANARFLHGSILKPSRQAKAAGSVRTLARLLLIVSKALVAAVIAHRRYELLRSKGISHDKAIRRVLVGGKTTTLDPPAAMG
jgi:hypothetical protein